MRAVSGKDLCRLLEQNGWLLLRAHGSHHIYGEPGSIVRLSVPVHGSKTLKKGLLKHLLEVAGLSASDL